MLEIYTPFKNVLTFTKRLKKVPEKLFNSSFCLFVCFFNKIKGLTWNLWQSFADYIKKKNQSP